MEPTLFEGDIVLAYTGYRGKLKYKINDLALFHCPLPPSENPIGRKHSKNIQIKRIVAMQGDQVQIKSNRLWINGVLVNDQLNKDDSIPYEMNYLSDIVEYRAKKDLDWIAKIIVPKGEYFVLGANRKYGDKNLDSHIFGFLSQDALIGKVLTVLIRAA